MNTNKQSQSGFAGVRRAARGLTRTSDGAHHFAAPAGTYRSLFEGSPHAVLLVDCESLRVLTANGAAAAEYGYRPEELAGLPLRLLWPGAEEALSRRRSGRPIEEVSWMHWRRGGEAIDVSVRLQDISLAGRAAVALHVGNVTERAFSEVLTEANRRLLEKVARGGPLPVILEELVRTMEDLSSGMIGSVLLLDEDGRHARHGAAPSLPPQYLQAIDGVEIGPSAGSWGSAMHLGRRVIVQDIAADPLWKDYRGHALPYGLRACWSDPLRSRGGRILGAFAMYYREARRPERRDLRLVEAASDLAAIAIERDVADRALHESEARLRAIVDHAPAVISLKDAAGRYMIVNRRFEQVTWIPAALALGRTDRQLFPRALAEAYSASDREVLQAQRPIALEEELVQADGPHVYLSVKFPLLRADRTAYAVCAIASDITERKRAERSLAQSHEQLRALTAKLQSVREEERARISRDIHDELGQMLTALRMNQSLLIRSVREAAMAGGESIAAQLESMREQVTTMLASVRRIATELRPEALDTIGLVAALESHTADFSRQAGIECRLSLPDGTLEAGAERSTALFRILQEALTNAARHSGASRVQVRLRRDGSFLEMTVADNGQGISEAEKRASSSLGLLGMRERAAMLGGTTDIAGERGRGTTVTVRLPAG